MNVPLCIAYSVHTVQEAVDPATIAFIIMIIVIVMIVIIVSWPSDAGPESLKS